MKKRPDGHKPRCFMLKVVVLPQINWYGPQLGRAWARWNNTKVLKTNKTYSKDHRKQIRWSGGYFTSSSPTDVVAAQGWRCVANTWGIIRHSARAYTMSAAKGDSDNCWGQHASVLMVGVSHECWWEVTDSAEFTGKDENASLQQHAGVELQQVPHIYCHNQLRQVPLINTSETQIPDVPLSLEIICFALVPYSHFQEWKGDFWGLERWSMESGQSKGHLLMIKLAGGVWFFLRLWYWYQLSFQNLVLLKTTRLKLV